MSQRILQTGNPIATERPQPRVGSNTFDFGSDSLLSGQIGSLYPVRVLECLPGDRWSIQSQGLVRLQPMIFPVLWRMKVRTEAFFVPSRLLWPNFENLISPPFEGASAPAMPFLQPDTPLNTGTRGDYMGIPAPLNLCPKVNALPFAAYEKICNDWYVDENLDVDHAIFTPLQDGDNSTISPNYITGLPRRRLYDRDYFTSALPFAQKGDAVVIPFVNVDPNLGNIPLTYDRSGGPAGLAPRMEFFPGGGLDAAGQSLVIEGGGTTIQGNSSLHDLSYNPEGTLSVNPADFLPFAGTIEELRRAEALQKFLEADAMGGTRYIETIYQHWDVRSSDSRLQRSEYIGSSTQVISISEVLNTTGTPDAPQGAMAGHGIAVPGHDSPLHYSCEEYGYIIILASIMPDTGYYQGVHPMFRRFDRLDYPWPEFAQLGSKAVPNGEIFFNDTDPEYTGVNGQVWGYLPQYTEFRMPWSSVGGDFKTNLDAWHMARKFASLPALNADFVICDNNEALERIFAVIDPSVDHLLMHWRHQIIVSRKLPRLVQPTI